MTAVGLMLCGSSALAQPPAGVVAYVGNTGIPGPAPVLIQNAKIYTLGSQGTLANGELLIMSGKIARVDINSLPMPGAKIIDAKGKPVTPGLMVSNSELGAIEIDLVGETNDSGPGQDLSAFDADGTDSPTLKETIASAAFDVSDAINPNSTLIAVARIRGVTRSLTAPAIGSGVFSGHAAVIDLGLGPNLVEKTRVGMVANLEPAGGPGAPSRPLIWAQFREMMDDAREYQAQRAAYHRPGGARDQRSSRIDLDALADVVEGREPLLVYVNRVSTIRQVLAYCRANKIKLVILGGSEAWMAASDLAAAHVPVVIDTELNLPNTFSDIGATLKNAARLDAAGVLVAFQPQSNGLAHYARTITQIAGNAVANGMKWDHALAAITRNPAEIWGLADSYGTLEPGKDADVVIWDGDPLEVTSAPTAVFIKGQQMPMTSRQTALRERYRDAAQQNPSAGYH